MARVNSGLNPKLLSDQHLVAESVEITMITGSLRCNNYTVKGVIPANYTLGKGHINFFKNKLIYLSNRLYEVNREMRNREFEPGTRIDLDEFPKRLHNTWQPNQQDTVELRKRVVDRLMHPKSGRPGGELHRYYGKPLGDGLQQFCTNIINSGLFYV